MVQAITSGPVTPRFADRLRSACQLMAIKPTVVHTAIAAVKSNVLPRIWTLL